MTLWLCKVKFELCLRLMLVCQNNLTCTRDGVFDVYLWIRLRANWAQRSYQVITRRKVTVSLLPLCLIACPVRSIDIDRSITWPENGCIVNSLTLNVDDLSIRDHTFLQLWFFGLNEPPIGIHFFTIALVISLIHVSHGYFATAIFLGPLVKLKFFVRLQRWLIDDTSFPDLIDGSLYPTFTLWCFLLLFLVDQFVTLIDLRFLSLATLSLNFHWLFFFHEASITYTVSDLISTLLWKLLNSDSRKQLSSLLRCNRNRVFLVLFFSFN